MSLKAELRTATGTSASRRARQEGLIPVSLYGKDTEATSLLINRREFEAILRESGSNAVFDIEFDGNTQKVFLKDYVRAALKDEVYNVDLEAISKDQKLQVEIPVYIINEDTIKEGIVETVMNTILVETKPDSIPQQFEVDVEGLEIGDGIRIENITFPEGVESLAEADELVITISAPTEEAEEVDPDAEEAEPEVIGEEESDQAEAEEE